MIGIGLSSGVSLVPLVGVVVGKGQVVDRRRLDAPSDPAGIGQLLEAEEGVVVDRPPAADQQPTQPGPVAGPSVAALGELPGADPDPGARVARHLDLLVEQLGQGVPVHLVAEPLGGSAGIVEVGQQDLALGVGHDVAELEVLRDRLGQPLVARAADRLFDMDRDLGAAAARDVQALAILAGRVALRIELPACAGSSVIFE